MEPTEQNHNTFAFAIRKTYLYVAVGMIIGFGGGFGVAKFLFAPAPASEPQAPSTASVITPQQTSFVQVAIEDRPSLGPEDARVTIVEFTDYQCAFCERHFRQTLPQLLKEYEGRLKYVVLNYPISSINPFSKKAAEAAECAYDQEKFWEYHDLLFQNQRVLDTDGLKNYARDIGLDTDAFDICLDSNAKTQRVLQDLLDGRNYGVTGTPTFFINGQKLLGAHPFENFKEILDALLGG